MRDGVAPAELAISTMAVAGVGDGGFAVTLRRRCQVVRGAVVRRKSRCRYVSSRAMRYNQGCVVAMACAAMDREWKSRGYCVDMIADVRMFADEGAKNAIRSRDAGLGAEALA